MSDDGRHSKIQDISVQGQLTSVNDLLAMQIGQAIQDSFCYFSKYFLPSSTTEFLYFSIDAV